MVSSKLYKITGIVGGALACLVLGITITLTRNTLLAAALFTLIFVVTYYLYLKFKQKEEEYIVDEREYRYCLEAFRYSSIIFALVFLTLFILKETKILNISNDFYLGFWSAFMVFFLSHMVVYRILLWLK